MTPTSPDLANFVLINRQTDRQTIALPLAYIRARGNKPNSSQECRETGKGSFRLLNVIHANFIAAPFCTSPAYAWAVKLHVY